MGVTFDVTFGVFVDDTGRIEPCHHRHRDPYCLACYFAGEPISEARLMVSALVAHRQSGMDYAEIGEAGDGEASEL